MALLDILMWVLPSGFLASLGTWILSRKTFSARNRKEQEVIYKQLYESQGDTLLKMDERITELQNQNIIINGNFAKMQRTLLTVATQAVRCRYWDVCPLRGELSKYKPSAEEYTAARVDSSSVTVTAVTDYEPVPMTQAKLNLTPTELERLPLMPMDFGKTVADGHLTLKAEPDGQGGIRITATHQGEERKVEKTTTTATNRIRDEFATTDERKDTHGRSYKLPAILLVVVLLAVIYWLVKYRTTGN